MGNNSSNRGYSLFELIIVLSFLSVIIGYAIQLANNHQKYSRVDLLVSELNELKNAIYAASKSFNQEVTTSFLVDENLYFGELVSPWGMPYRIEHTESGTYVAGYAKNNQYAELSAKHLAGAHVEGGWVHVFVHHPNREISDSLYLHRDFDVERPYLNQMNTDLDMGGNNLLNTTDIIANAGEFFDITVQSAWLSDLTSSSANIDALYTNQLVSENAGIHNLQTQVLEATELSVTDFLAGNLMVTAPVITVQNLNVSSLQGGSLSATNLSVANQLLVDNAIQVNSGQFEQISANNLSSQVGNFQQLTAAQLNAQSLTTENLNVASLTANQLDIDGHFHVAQLIANNIIATDFITANSSLVAVQKLAAKIESLWLQCTDSGGCR